MLLALHALYLLSKVNAIGGYETMKKIQVLLHIQSSWSAQWLTSHPVCNPLNNEESSLIFCISLSQLADHIPYALFLGRLLYRAFCLPTRKIDIISHYKLRNNKADYCSVAWFAFRDSNMTCNYPMFCAFALLLRHTVSMSKIVPREPTFCTSFGGKLQTPTLALYLPQTSNFEPLICSASFPPRNSFAAKVGCALSGLFLWLQIQAVQCAHITKNTMVIGPGLQLITSMRCGC